MPSDRRISALRDPDQWARCAHQDTTLDSDGGIELTWIDASTPNDGGGTREHPGIAFDRWGRGLWSHPDRGTIEVVTLDRVPDSEPPIVEGLNVPLGIGIDAEQRLLIAESGSGDVVLVDLLTNSPPTRRSLRSDSSPNAKPLDVVIDQRTAWVLVDCPVSIVKFVGGRGPYPSGCPQRPRHRGPVEPLRMTRDAEGRLVVLWRCEDGTGVVARLNGHVELAVPDATDIEADGDGVLIVARRPGQAFRRFRPAGQLWEELQPVVATTYDGGCIAAMASGRICFTTDAGIDLLSGASASAVRYAVSGRVVTYRLDSEVYRTRWGRIFVDACVPPGTALSVRFVSSDDDLVEDPIPWRAPENRDVVVRRPDLTPPLVSTRALIEASPPQALHRRSNGREVPWRQIRADDNFETYEAPVRAGLGRYLWLVFDLTGTGTRTPRIREVRVEHPAHRLMSYLPRSWSRDENDADFLHRLLSPTEGLFHELDERAASREIFLDPQTTPQEALPWLASFLGLTLDRRWPIQARRTLIAEATYLLQRRGTIATLSRMIEIYLGRPPTILEQWRLRGVGGIQLGGRVARSPMAPRHGDPVLPVLGALTVGGSTTAARFPYRGLTEDAFETNAHRFTVLVPIELTKEQLDVVTRIVMLHRPAHTDFEICETGVGMRVGSRLHVGLTSKVGPSARCAPRIGSPT